MADNAIARVVAACEIDHAVRPVPGMVGGSVAGTARLEAFIRHGLPHYADRRNEAADPDGTSALSPYLHYGQVAGAAVVRAALASGAGAAGGA
jgi:deoxyribodipyrimidine photolyase